MSSIIGIIFLIFTLITLIVMTFMLHYANQGVLCDADPQFICFDDWVCDGGTGSHEKLSCVLKSFYNNISTPADSTECPGYKNRSPNVCDGNSICNGNSIKTSPPSSNPDDLINQCFCNMGTNGMLNPNTSACATMPDNSSVCKNSFY